MNRNARDAAHLIDGIHHSVMRNLTPLLILQSAQHAPTYGGAISKLLRRFHHAASPGTLYPLLHALEHEKLLRSSTISIHGRVRRYYELTADGSQCLAAARTLLLPLLREVLATAMQTNKDTELEGP
jgi:PadR family transcriptional regulator PadR